MGVDCPAYRHPEILCHSLANGNPLNINPDRVLDTRFRRYDMSDVEELQLIL